MTQPFKNHCLFGFDPDGIDVPGGHLYVVTPGVFGGHFLGLGIITHYAEDLLPERTDGGLRGPDSVFWHKNRTVHSGNGQVLSVCGSRVSGGSNAVLFQVIFFEYARCKCCGNIFECTCSPVQIVAVSVDLKG
ncbi:hypothetical protein SDC9_138846 [bioreactor metagenome]|uniref:Uncharacterized protein n=1 Tax=bioreactor metagenome TaxID=1076179 RepID=A0A645DQH6_9ZZZZ